MRERIPEVVFHDERPLEQKPSWRRVLDETASLQKAKFDSEGRHSLERSTIEPEFTNDRPKLFLFPADMHWFSPQTDYERIKEALTVLERPDTFGLFLGDEIEGQKPDALEQSTGVLYSADVQIKKFKEVLYDLVSRGKVLGLAGGYSGHLEWIKRFSGVDGIQVMADRIKFPDGSDLRVLIPWGLFSPRFPNKKGFSLLIFHNPGSGASDNINPNGAVRNRVIEYRQDPRNKNNPIIGALGADKHHRGAYSNERSIDPDTGKETYKILGSLGSFKGTDSKNPDPFLVKMGKGASVPAGFGLVVIPRKIKNGNPDFVWGTYGDGFGKITTLHEAASIWDAAERQGITAELISKEIIANPRIGKPVMLDDIRRLSSQTTSENSVEEVKLYKRFGKVIKGSERMPYRIEFLANMRYGSSSNIEGKKMLKLLLSDAEKDPYTFALVMRHFMDSDVAGRWERKEILDQMIKDLSPVYKQGRLIAIMMSESFRNKKWQKDLIRWVPTGEFNEKTEKEIYDKEVQEGFRPGDYIFNKSSIKGTLLYTNRAKFKFRVGTRDFLIQIMDHLGSTGSKFAIFRGLHKSQDEGPVDIVAGGHMPGAGNEVTPFTTYIAPGWGSEYDSEGVANKDTAPTLGVSADFYRGEIYSASSRDVSNDQHIGLMLHGGLSEVIKKKVLSKVK